VSDEIDWIAVARVAAEDTVRDPVPGEVFVAPSRHHRLRPRIWVDYDLTRWEWREWSYEPSIWRRILTTLRLAKPLPYEFAYGRRPRVNIDYPKEDQ